MVSLAAEAARGHSLNEKTLRLTLAETAHNSHGDGATVNQALEKGWKLDVDLAMADRIISSDEEDGLKEFQNQVGTTSVRPDTKEDSHGTLADKS